MNRTFFIAMLTVLLTPSLAVAQSQDLPKFEVAAEFTTLERDDFSGQRTEPGFGGRFTYNLNRIFSSRSGGLLLSEAMFSVPEQRSHHRRAGGSEGRETV